MTGPVTDLDADSRRALEFDELLEWLASLARTPMGRRAVFELVPMAQIEAVREELATVDEACRLAEREEALVGHGLPDPGPALEVLGIEGARLDPTALRNLAAVVAAASSVGRRLATLEREEFPILSVLGGSLPDLSEESRVVLRHVEPEGHVADGASPELGRIRRERQRLTDRLQQRLQSILHAPSSASAIRDDFITQRNGRYVIPVRSDSPRPIRGIVHAESSSGATRFVEPLESVELNNDLVRLAERERQEVERLLLMWTEAFRRRAPEVEDSLSGLARVDGLQARALFARECRCVTPVVEQGAALKLVEARHPLLDRRLRQQGTEIVPLSLELDPADRVLVLSGPNTGGKTVALKTVGLSSLMAQSGIPVPGRTVQLPLYRQVRADIGDHQSIQADLSTFSAHIGAVVGILEAATAPALFLFDEIGSGTEPHEGAALAEAVLEALLSHGLTTLATTHQRALKAWAVTTPGAESAAMEFDSEFLRPTYRILMGVAGVSAGLEIATRLGMAPEIVKRARASLGTDAAQGEAYLERLRTLIADLEERHARAERHELALAERERRQGDTLERDRRLQLRETERRLEAALREMRAVMKRGLSAIGDRRERAAASREVARLEGSLRLEKARHQADLGADPQQRRPLAAEGVREGMAVFVRSLAREGEVSSIRGDRVDVRLGNVTVNVERSDLRSVASPGSLVGRSGNSAGGPGPSRSHRIVDRLRGSSDSTAPPEVARAAPLELKLLGMTVEEALEAVDRFLDEACLEGCDQVRLIHGYGTGRLRQAVRQHVRSHPQVDRWRPGGTGEGDDGVTVVQLK